MRLQLATIATAFILAGCAGGAGSLTGTVVGTQNLRTPEYEVKGRTAYDQRWINITTEALVDGFGQPRPKARPKEFDAPRPKAKAKSVAKAAGAKAAPNVKGKRWFPPARKRPITQFES